MHEMKKADAQLTNEKTLNQNHTFKVDRSSTRSEKPQSAWQAMRDAFAGRAIA